MSFLGKRFAMVLSGFSRWMGAGVPSVWHKAGDDKVRLTVKTGDG